jgi:excisionase family DNA binding protein
MMPTSLVIEPEDVRSSSDDPMTPPSWLEKVATYVRQAASEGETVTLTTKQRLLTPEQIASMTGVSRSTISRKIKAGEIRAVKVGNRNRIPYDEFHRYWDDAMANMATLTSDDIEAELAGDA